MKGQNFSFVSGQQTSITEFPGRDVDAGLHFANRLLDHVDGLGLVAGNTGLMASQTESDSTSARLALVILAGVSRT